MVLGHDGERQVIVAGGYRYNSDMAQYIMRSTVDIFSLDMQHWSVGRDMPDARTTQAYVSNGQSLYVFGGFDGLNALRTILEYNASQERWRRRVEVMPKAISRPAAFYMPNWMCN